jgi:hypothetical protein
LSYTDVRDLEEAHLLCRYLRHSWDPHPGVDLSGLKRVDYATEVIAVRCVRCGRERIEYLDRKGWRIGRPYWRDPMGYPKVHRTSGEVLRAEMIRRNLLVQKYPYARPRRRRAA